MPRKEDWPDLLLAEIDRHSELPFEYGVSDCITFACDCVKVMTDVDPMEGHRDYDSLEGGQEELAEAGYADIAEAFADHFEEIPVAMAGRGDIGILEGGDIAIAVVFVGPHAVGKETPEGVSQVRMTRCSRAFRVP